MLLLEDHRRSKVKEKTVYLDVCKKPFMQQILTLLVHTK